MFTNRGDRGKTVFCSNDAPYIGHVCCPRFSASTVHTLHFRARVCCLPDFSKNVGELY
jgi:hypothetical protein